MVSFTLPSEDIDAVLDYLCKVSLWQPVYFLWRPYLRDPEDDMVLEVAVAARCECIVTFNKSDFAGTDRFGIRTVTPPEFLREIGAFP